MVFQNGALKAETGDEKEFVESTSDIQELVEKLTDESVKRLTDEFDKEVIDDVCKSVKPKDSALLCGIPDEFRVSFSTRCLEQQMKQTPVNVSSKYNMYSVDKRLMSMSCVKYVKVPEATIETVNRVQDLSVLSCIKNI